MARNRPSILLLLRHSVFLFLLLLQLVRAADPDQPPQFSGKDVTRALFGKKVNEELYPVAFGDFNADKLTDIIAVDRDQSTISLFLAELEEPFFSKQFDCSIMTTDTVGVKILGANLADFNGDGMMDVMVAFVQPGVVDPAVEVVVFPGNGSEFLCAVKLDDTIKMQDEPLIIDIDGDMVMDLIGVEVVNRTHKGEETNQVDHGPRRRARVWKFSATSDPTKTYVTAYDLRISRDLPRDVEQRLSPHFKNATTHQPNIYSFVDIDGDTVPEIVNVTKYTSEKGGNSIFFAEYYEIGEPKGLSWDMSLVDAVQLNYENNSVQVLGQSVFLDLNQDGNLVHIIPGCSQLNKCGIPKLLVVSKEHHKATTMNVNFQVAGKNWIFDLTRPNYHQIYNNSIILRVGDYNMDGFPDLIGVLTANDGSYSENTEHRAVIFENVPCTPADPTDTSCIHPRTFRLDIESLAQYKNVDMATFFDIYDDGLLDVLLVRRTTNNSDQYPKDEHACHGFLSNPDYDANFLKVVVTTGRDCPKCPLNGIPYGSIIPGPVVRYNSTTQVGDLQTSVAAQFYRSAHFPLDLPYVFFGIGHSPNFIDVLDVSVSHKKSMQRSKKWTQLIPNSQIIVIPYLPDESYWKAKIFLPSSKAAVHTFGVLLGFCGVIAIIVFLLHWKERTEDRKERLAESHRFHMM